ncbi:helix-turn-helix domain-containing protein [Arthrobacter bussei]|uniref:Helix-turn-helix domain-containing protein n=1 Tax=Arthrobacter bussei TaxID=2594179 RepID=A0A7X1TPX8_9MICC|nr:helix-turn-helix domain-containing protein [Arthrobacter bussei]
MSNRPAFTLSEAAERTNSSRSTMRRYREAGKFPNAYKGTDSQWRVPVEDLLANGLTLSGQAQPEQVSAPTEQAPPTGGVLVERVRELEAALAVERAKAEGLERVAAAAEANAADLRMALRMIEAARPEQGERAQAEHVSAPTEQGVSRPTEQDVSALSGQDEQARQVSPEHPGGGLRSKQNDRSRRRWWQWGTGPY